MNAQLNHEAETSEKTQWYQVKENVSKEETQRGLIWLNDARPNMLVGQTIEAVELEYSYDQQKQQYVSGIQLTLCDKVNDEDFVMFLHITEASSYRQGRDWGNVELC